MTWMRIIHNLNRIIRIRMGPPQMGASQHHVRTLSIYTLSNLSFYALHVHVVNPHHSSTANFIVMCCIIIISLIYLFLSHHNL